MNSRQHEQERIMEEKIDFSWIGDQRREVVAKVSFFNSCGFFRRTLFSFIHGRNFRPTENEKRLYIYFKQNDTFQENPGDNE